MTDRDGRPDARREPELRREHDAVHEWDAGYVLGGLSADERARFERHLCGCPACTASVADLAGLPAVLRLLPVDDAVSIADEARVAAPAPEEARVRSAAPGSEEARVGSAAPVADDRPRASRRPGTRRPGRSGARPRASGRVSSPRRGVLVGAAAALVVVLLAGGGYALGSASGRVSEPTAAVSTPTPAVPVAMTSLVGGAVTADLSVTATPWGTRFDWECAYAADLEGTGVYDLVVEEVDGTRTVVATWDSAPGGAAGLAASSKLPLDRLRSVEITAADSTTVLTRTTL
jgi:anti-sigma factor RsiW